MNKHAQAEQNIINYMTHMISPVTIDNIVDLSGISVVDVLNAMEALKRRNLVYEKVESERGIYYIDDELKNHAEKELSDTDRNKILKKLIEFYVESLVDSDNKTVVLARLYSMLGNSLEGMSCLKNAADLLYRKGEREKAITYLNNILKFFQKAEIDELNVTLYLEATLGYIVTAFELRPVDYQVPLLIRADKMAKKFKKYELLAPIKYHLSKLYIVLRQMVKATRVTNSFLAFAEDLDNSNIYRLAVLAKSELLIAKGRIKEAMECYEDVIGNLEDFGDDDITLRLSARIGRFYVVAGRLARGMGLINTVGDKLKLFGLSKTALFADIMMTYSYLEIRKIDEAKALINQIAKSLHKESDYTTHWTVYQCEAYILATEGNYPDAYKAYQKAMKYDAFIGRIPYLNAFNIELLTILSSQGYFEDPEYLTKKIEPLINGDDIFAKGFALRYRALINQKKNLSHTIIIRDLETSEKLLDSAGAEIELARTRIALGDYYIKKGNSNKAGAYLEKAWKFFSRVDKSLFPKDLISIMPNQEKTEYVVNELTRITESLGTVHESSVYLEKALNIAMDYTMATQGAIFVIDSKEPTVVASRNVDMEYSANNYFKIIKQVIRELNHVNGEIIYPGPDDEYPILEKKLKRVGIKSLICVPARRDNETLIYLCLNNCLGNKAFPRDVIPFLRMLCTQIGVSLSNISLLNETKRLKDKYESEVVYYRKELSIDGRDPFENIIGASEETKKVLDQIRQVAPMSSSVLILGETGVGKELVAKTIHNLSPRKDGPFISFNISTLPNDLVASELFGHEKGAFTGANAQRQGRFELADGGTIFLDEIGDLPLNMQVKLLRVLEESEFERLGSSEKRTSDFRVLAATNKSLLAEVEKGNFRQDLYFRLNVFPIQIAPLRERKEDIPYLVTYFQKKFEKKTNQTDTRITKREINRLLNYHWPGNVRELKHSIERAMILSKGQNVIFPEFESISTKIKDIGEEVLLPLTEIERNHIIRVLDATGWKVNGKDGAAEILEMKPSTVFFRMKKLGISRPKVQYSNLET